MTHTIARAQDRAPADTLTVRPLTPQVGAEILGVDVCEGIDERTFLRIRDALHRHGVIVLREQQLSPATQVRLAERFGPLRVSFYNKYAVPGHPELTVVSNIVEDGRSIGIADAGMLWHTDASYLRTPDAYTLLYAIEVPAPEGAPLGDTLFSSAAAAYEALTEHDRQRLDGLKGVHSFAWHLERKAQAGQLKRAPLSAAQKSETPDVQHPVVRTHPVTARRCLYVTEGHTAAIAGMSTADSDALLAELTAHLARPEFIYRHHWRPGDLVIWDNCTVHHLAVFDYGERRRRLHRTGICGPVPE
ncbi:MAG: TauD/TfdA dioxygenase family protein [Lautropia sp.]